MNGHVDPVFAGILHAVSGDAANDAAQRLLKCRVTLAAPHLSVSFDGLYPTTAHAVDDGIRRAGSAACAVTARVLP